MNVKNADKPSGIQALKKLSGHKTAYRIRVGDYRIGIFITKDTVEFIDFGHRKELYQTFPN